MSLHDRIKEARKNKGFTQEQLGEAIGVAKTTVAGYEKNREPTAAKVGEIADVLGVDVNFLFQDEVKELHESHATPKEFEKVIKKYRALDDHGREMVDMVLDKETERVNSYGKLSAPVVPLRIYTYMNKIACAGSGFYFDDIPTDTMEAPYLEGADFIIGVNGDSMEPTFSDGDLVYVEKRQIIETGDIGIFILNKECLIKEAGEEGLISHNPDYEMIPGTEHIICVGKVLGKVEK